MSRTVVGLTRQKVEGLRNGSERGEIVAENCWVGTVKLKCRERLKDWNDKGWRDCGMVPGGGARIASGAGAGVRSVAGEAGGARENSPARRGAGSKAIVRVSVEQASEHV